MNPVQSERRGVKGSVVVKMIVIGVLILVLLIPLFMVGGLVSERQQRHDAMTAEVASAWGNAQVLGGPILVVPYHEYGRDEKGEVTYTQLAYFLPESLKVAGKIAPEMRSRGIFDVVVYRADLRLSGTFRRPSFTGWDVAAKEVLWDQAYLAMGVTDMRGIRRGVQMTWAGRPLPLSPGGAAQGLWSSGLQAPIAGLAAASEEATWDFGFDLLLNGSGRLDVLPFGKQTTLALSSSWPSPSFSGRFLPETRDVKATGFQATWNVPYFGRSYPQRWRSTETEKVAAASEVSGSAFGVELFLPVGIYQKTERSVKYGLLFIVLTFLTFFLYEVFSPFALHPMQYLLVGSALCLFYVLLLSISEHLAFGVAYVLASGATISLISGYASAILRGRLRALGVGAALTALYGYLFVLLQAEDFALLLGSVGLFLILAAVMYITRRIDWYTPRTGEARMAVEPAADLRP